jgi:hypothetical protein
MDRRTEATVMPWRRLLDAHLPLAHWSFFVVWAITASIGPIVFGVGLIEGSDAWLLGLAIYSVALVAMAIDWVLLRRLRRNPHWTPWEPPRRGTGA